MCISGLPRLSNRASFVIQMVNVALESEEGKHMCFTTTSSSEDVAAAAFQVIVCLCIHPFLACRRVHMCFDVLPVAAIRRRISAKEFVGCCGGTGNEVVVVVVGFFGGCFTGFIALETFISFPAVKL